MSVVNNYLKLLFLFANRAEYMEHGAAADQRAKQQEGKQAAGEVPPKLDGIIRMALMHDPLVSFNFI